MIASQRRVHPQGRGSTQRLSAYQEPIRWLLSFIEDTLLTDAMPRMLDETHCELDRQRAATVIPSLNLS
jgi:hypothetical protein